MTTLSSLILVYIGTSIKLVFTWCCLIILEYIFNQGGPGELSFPSFSVSCELWASYERTPSSRQNELRFCMYIIVQDSIHTIYCFRLINSKSCSFSISCKCITFFFIFMNIVTQYIENSLLTLSESDNEKLFDIMKFQLIVPRQNVTTNTVLKSSLQTVVLLIIL